MKLFISITFLTTFILPGCSKEKNLYNESASFSDSTKIANVLEEKVITTMSDKNEKTMSTLYGNDIAAEYARSSSDKHYPAGSELSLVTWFQKEDIHWFGAAIPGKIKSVEIVKYTGNDSSSSYVCYAGNLLKLQEKSVAETMERTSIIISLKAAVLP